ncbi:GtrA family protein [Cryobacterium sp. TMT1-3]|uniref:GtrA family protein n=1 Tax=Cryobacterium sp. TMT1-3 TaxID=1259237 RepID=UPI00141AF7AE
MFRFLLIGGSNTLFTGGLVVVLSLFLPGVLAFTIAFMLGLAYSVLFTGRWVFRSMFSRRRILLYVASYGVIYLCGVGLVAVVTACSLTPLANGASVLLTAPLSFIAGRAIFSSPLSRQETHA